MSQSFLTIATVLSHLLGPPPPVTIGEAIVGPVQILDTASHDVLPGVLRPRHEVTLGSPFDTLLGEVRVEEGQRVRKGDIVAVLDDRVTRASVRLAEQQAARTAQIDRAQAVVDQAEDKLARLEEASRSSAAANSELTAARSDRKVAVADLLHALEAHAEALLSLTLAQARLDEHVIRAPFDAVAIRVLAEPGAMLSPGEPIVELISTDSLCVDLHLPAFIASGLKPGDHYALNVEDPVAVVTPARVRYVEPRIDPVSRTMRVVFDLDACNANLFAGSLTRPAPQLAESDAPKTDASADAGSRD